MHYVHVPDACQILQAGVRTFALYAYDRRILAFIITILVAGAVTTLVSILILSEG